MTSVRSSAHFPVASVTRKAHINVSSQGRFCEFVFEHLYQWRQSGLKTALLTLVNIEGSSPRPLGSQLGVCESGAFVGLISGGCLEAALVEEALLCIQQRRSKCLRFGRDSDYFDIQLPCGSGVDVLIQPIVDEDVWLENITALARLRQPFVWCCDINAQLNTVSTDRYHCERPQPKNLEFSRAQMDADFKCFTKSFQPRHRAVVVGGGAVFDYFIHLSGSFDFDVQAYGASALALDFSLLDRWSSLIILSHDHEWEHSILARALATDVGFISALGSQKTHAVRLQRLADDGFDSERVDSIKGPAGLDIGSQNPPEIALSILAEVVHRKNLS